MTFYLLVQFGEGKVIVILSIFLSWCCCWLLTLLMVGCYCFRCVYCCLILLLLLILLRSWCSTISAWLTFTKLLKLTEGWGVAPHLPSFARWLLLLIIICCYWFFLFDLLHSGLFIGCYWLLLVVIGFFCLVDLTQTDWGVVLIFRHLLHSGPFCWLLLIIICYYGCCCLLFVVMVVLFLFCWSYSNWLHRTIRHICKRFNNSWMKPIERKQNNMLQNPNKYILLNCWSDMMSEYVRLLGGWFFCLK